MNRAIVVFAEDADAADDVTSLLGLADARPFHPSTEGFGRGEQKPWTDEECRDYAWDLLQRLAGKTNTAVSLIVPS